MPSIRHGHFIRNGVTYVALSPAGEVSGLSTDEINKRITNGDLTVHTISGCRCVCLGDLLKQETGSPRGNPEEKTPTSAATDSGQINLNQSKRGNDMREHSVIANTKRQHPLFPSNEKQAHHARAALAMLLRGDQVDQYQYASETGFPNTDFRTRISDLGKLGWEIGREFHWGVDHDGTMRRCKTYWLEPETLAELFQQFPEFEQRCMMLLEKEAA